MIELAVCRQPLEIGYPVLPVAALLPIVILVSDAVIASVHDKFPHPKVVSGGNVPLG